MTESAPSESRTVPGVGSVGGAAALNPAAMSIPDAARVLSRAGGFAVTEEMLRADIEAGTPVNADGTVNLVHYAAWLVRETAREQGGANDGD